MCKERTCPTLRQNTVSFHLCLQESYVLTVAHSNKNVFYFTLLKVRTAPGAKTKAASVCNIRTIVYIAITAITLTAVVVPVAPFAVAKGMNPLQ